MQPVAAEPEAGSTPAPVLPTDATLPRHLRTFPDGMAQPWLLNDIDTRNLRHSDGIRVIRTATRNINRNRLWIDAANLWIS
jgi:hypothetical protein